MLSTANSAGSWVTPTFDHGPVLSAVVDPIGESLALGQTGEILAVYFPRFPFRSPRAIRVFKGSHHFLLLGIYRNHRVARCDQRFHLPVDVPELCIPVGVLWALLRLAVGLQRISHIVQATRYRHPRDGVP